MFGLLLTLRVLLLHFTQLPSSFLFLPLNILLYLCRSLSKFLIFVLSMQLVGYFYDCAYLDMVLHILEIGHDDSELAFDDGFLAGEDDGDGEEVDELHAVLLREDDLPQTQGVEQREILGVEQSYPAEAVEERIDFESVQSAPDIGVDHLAYSTLTTSISLKSLSFPYIPFLLLSKSLI